MRSTTTLVVFAMAILAPGLTMAQGAGGSTVPTVRLRVLDRASVDPLELKAAEEVVTAIYQKAGVATLWNEYGVEPPADDTMNITVLVVSGPASEATANAFGLARDVLAFVPGAATNRGRLIYVFNDRVHAQASHSWNTYSALLGQVIAHEIGHVLLPFHSHSSTGIMRAAVDAKSVRLEFFTDAQAAAMRDRLASR